MPVTIASSSNTTRLEWFGAAVARLRSACVPPRKTIAPGYRLQHVAEVFGAHDRVRESNGLVGADELLGQIQHDIGLGFVVHRHRVPVDEIHDHLGIVRRGDAFGNSANTVVNGAASSFR